MKDPLVIEMFNVLDERFPNFNVRKAEEYVKRPSETLIHGDFHSGNVMLGEGSNKGIDWSIDFTLNVGKMINACSEIQEK